MPLTFLKLLIAFFICAFLIHTFDLKLTSLISDITGWHYLALTAVIPITFSSFFSVNRWQVFLRFNSIDETLASLWKINLVSQFQGLILPSSQGADAFRMFHIERRHPKKQGAAGSTVIIERMIGLLVLCTFTLFAFPFLPASNNYAPLLMTVSAVSCIAVATQIILTSKKIHTLYNSRIIKNPLLSLVLAYIQKLHARTIDFPYRRAITSSLLFICCYQISLILVVDLVFRAYGYDIPFIQHFALYPIIAILTMIPITVGGLGVREGFFVYFYGLLDVPADIAVGVSLTNYILMVLIPAACGGVIHLWDIIQEDNLKNIN